MPKIKVSTKWLYYVLTAIELRSLNEASGVPSLTRSALENINIYVPDYEDQLRLLKLITSIDETIDYLKTKQEKTKKITAMMLNKLMGV